MICKNCGRDSENEVTCSNCGHGLSGDVDCIPEHLQYIDELKLRLEKAERPEKEQFQTSEFDSHKDTEHFVAVDTERDEFVEKKKSKSRFVIVVLLCAICICGGFIAGNIYRECASRALLVWKDTSIQDLNSQVEALTQANVTYENELRRLKEQLADSNTTQDLPEEGTLAAEGTYVLDYEQNVIAGIDKSGATNLLTILLPYGDDEGAYDYGDKLNIFVSLNKNQRSVADTNGFVSEKTFWTLTIPFTMLELTEDEENQAIMESGGNQDVAVP